MGYRDDFYTRENILGYTGDLSGVEFTVYFADAGALDPRTVMVDGKEKVLVSFGRITQHYPDNPKNVGRGAVHEAWSYSIYNDKGHAKECVYGQRELRSVGLKGRHDADGHMKFHESRGTFEAVTSGNIEILAQAIKRFPNAKPKVA